jgi:hypothetical protein
VTGVTQRLALLRRQFVLTGVRHDVVKIHGQHRTGTNFVQKLLKVNAPQVVSPWPEESGWKHGPFEDHRRRRYLIVARHPMAWAESFHNWELAHHRTTLKSFGEFLRAPLSDERSAKVWNCTGPLELYATSYAAWLASPLSTAVLRYEDVLEDLDAALTMLFRELDLPTPTHFTDWAERADMWETSVIRRPLDRDHSIQGWRSITSERDTEYARSVMPAGLLEQLGYEF